MANKEGNPGLIQKTADNMVDMMQQVGFNGIDLDYEWGAPHEP